MPDSCSKTNLPKSVVDLTHLPEVSYQIPITRSDVTRRLLFLCEEMEHWIDIAKAFNL